MTIATEGPMPPRASAVVVVDAARAPPSPREEAPMRPLPPLPWSAPVPAIERDSSGTWGARVQWVASTPRS